MMQIKKPSEIYTIAINFLDDHQAAYLLAADEPLLVKRCIKHVLEACSYYCSAKYARDITLQAFSEIKSRHLDEIINLAHSTSHALFVRNAVTGHEWVIPIADLIAQLPQFDLISQLERSDGEQLIGNEHFFC